MSDKMTPSIWLLMFATIALVVAGQLLVKRGMLDVGGANQAAQLPRFILRAVTNPFVLLGVAAVGIGAPCWLLVLAHANLSLAYPFMGLTIVLVLAFSGPLFGEGIPLNRWIGVGIVCVGLIVAART